MNYKDFAFIVHFNHVMTFGTLTPLVQSRGAVLELMKDRLQRVRRMRASIAPLPYRTRDRNGLQADAVTAVRHTKSRIPVRDAAFRHS